MNDILKNYFNESKVIKQFDYEAKSISYNLIKQNREIKKISGDEEVVRAYLLEKLVKDLGYLPEDIEIEKEYDIGRPKVTKPRIDIIVKEKGSENPFFFIEVKQANKWEDEKEEAIEKQLFNLAGAEVALGAKIKYLVYYTFQIVNGEIRDKCIIIDYHKYKSFSEWRDERNYLDELPSRYGKAQKQPFIKGGNKDFGEEFLSRSN